ncbi:MAG: acylphosphatase [Methylovirgula sp.]
MAGEETIIRIFARGRVQGVGYRNFTLVHATTLGVAGWVRNRSNGDVEAVFAGRVEAVEALCDRCRRGPEMAVVEALEIIETDRSALAEVGWVGGFLQLVTL